MFSIIAIVTVGGAIMIPFALGNINLNYQQPTPTFTNYTPDMSMASTFKPTETVISLGVRGYDFPNLAHKAELIILGKVISQTNGGKQGESTPGVPDTLTHLPTINSLIQIEKVIKGQYTPKTINVFTEGDLTGNVKIEDSADIKKNDHGIFFLFQEPVWKGKWTIVGLSQGKFNVDNNGNVQGKLAAGNIKASIAGLEAKLKDVLSKPIPKVQSSDHTKDLTTAEANKANEEAKQSLIPDTDTQTNTQTNNNQPDNQIQTQPEPSEKQQSQEQQSQEQQSSKTPSQLAQEKRLAELQALREQHNNQSSG